MTTATEPLNRALTVGGSDVAAVLGISPFRTPLDVWREKVLGQRDKVDSPATRAGDRFEPHVLAAYRATLPAGATVTKPAPTVRDHLRASPDGIADVNGCQRLAEIKTTAFAQDWGRDGTEDVPLHYAVQAYWYMQLLGIDEADFPVLLWPHDMRDLLGLTPAEIVEACELRTLKLPFSPSTGAMLLDAVDRFWTKHVVPQVPPPSVDLEDAKRLIWTTRGKTCTADEELVRLLTERDALKAAAKKLDEQVDANEHAIRLRIADAEAVLHPTTGKPIATLAITERAAYVANVKATSFRTLRTTKNWKDLNQ